VALSPADGAGDDYLCVADYASTSEWDLDLDSALRESIAKICDVPVERVRGETLLTELGVDSLAVAEVIVELEIRLDRELPIHLLRRLDRVRTVDDVLGELSTELGGAGSP
jgi:acyl carrier protein